MQKVATMKTKPIGVRFNAKLLESTGLSPQKALNLYENIFLNKDSIPKEKDIANKIKEEYPLTEKEYIPPHPKKEDYQDAFDFSIAKNEWKKKYNL